ncbi:MAG: FKBP-type peptidyl-prolyl cis-trans isomerase [Bacteroidota bacterium]
MPSTLRKAIACAGLLLPLLLLFACSKKGNFQYTKSGYFYTHHIKNEGTKPKVGDQIFYHQTVFKNDSLLLSTYYLMRPRKTILPPPDSIPNPAPPDYEALQLMAAGDSLTIYQTLDTFKNLPPGVSNKDTFIYHLKLFDIKNKELVDAELAVLKAREQSVGDSLRQFIRDFKDQKLADQLKTEESGLQYIVHDRGKGREINGGEWLDVHYSGFLMEEETSFENTFQEARPIVFRIGRGQVIAGWEEMLPKLSVGGKATVYVPYTLAYGEAGRSPDIPERADLVFFVEIVDIR